MARALTKAIRPGLRHGHEREAGEQPPNSDDHS
jgi:hypothetical protein